MKTDVEIQQDVFQYVKGGLIDDAINGEVRILPRSTKSNKEDCIISILDNDPTQIQFAFVNVNVYVPNITNGGESVGNLPRIKVLAKLCSEVLKEVYLGAYSFWLVKQRVLPVEGKDEYVINNKIKYSFNNE